MITKYNLYKESLLDKISGPSKEEVTDELDKMTPQKMLNTASEIGNLEYIKKAVELGANLEYNTGAPVRSIVKSGNVAGLKYMIEKGMKSYLHIANLVSLVYSVESGNIEMVKYVVNLLEYDDVLRRLREMMELAKKNGYDEIEEYLYEYLGGYLKNK